MQVRKVKGSLVVPVSYHGFAHLAKFVREGLGADMTIAEGPVQEVGV